jgi:hypothetical protein
MERVRDECRGAALAPSAIGGVLALYASDASL